MDPLTDPVRLSPEIFDLLVCPDCRAALREKEGVPVCSQCGRAFHPEGGLPSLLPSASGGSPHRP